MKACIRLTMAALMLTQALPAWAEPTLYPNNLSVLSGIDNQTSSNIIADHSDTKTVWVMPPNTATATVSGLHSKLGWMGYCKEMSDQQGYSRDLSRDIKEVMSKRKEKQDEIAKEQARADRINEECEKYAADEGLQALVDVDTRIQGETLNLTELNKQLEACTHDCDAIKQQITDSNAALKVMRKDRNDIARQNAQAAMKYDQKKAQAKAAQRRVENMKGGYLELVKQLADVQNTFRQSFSFFATKPGAKAAIAYTSDWMSNVEKLRQKNPGYNFSKIATQNANLMTVLTSVGNVDAEGGIIRIETGGTVKDGITSYPAYPEALSANVVLSLIGACPMEHPEYFDIKDNDPANMKYGVVITYDYQTLFTAKAKISYDYYKMYEKIVSSGSSGGLFSSRSWSNVEEKNFFKDSFAVEWQDAENTIPQTEKEAREQEMRRSILSRLATMALPASANIAGIIAAAPPPARGAVVAADQLMKTCPANIYCAGTAAVLTVLDAIFGSSSATANYKNIQQGDLHETYSNTSKITKSWITSYL